MSVTLLAFVATVIAASFVLVTVFRLDERFERGFDAEHRWMHPWRSRGWATFRAALGYGAVSVVLAILLPALWHTFSLALPFLPKLPAHAAHFVEVWGRPYSNEKMLAVGRMLIEDPFQHQAAMLCMGALFVWTMFRCLTTPLYDIFISYKSEDVALARRIAEALMASGWRVWFAEYRVLLSFRRWFTNMFVQGIRASDHGLVITNNRWANSEHCGREIHWLQQFINPRSILELRLPREPLPHQRFPKLAESPSLESNDLKTILTFIGANTDVERTPVPTPEPPVQRGWLTGNIDGRPCRVMLAGWTLEGGADGSIESMRWHYDGLPKGVLSGTAAVATGKAVDLDKQQRFGSGIEDKYMFDVLAYWARKGFKKYGGKPRGVHLYFYDGRAQMGLTFWAAATANHPACWTRAILLDLKNPVTGAALHFQFRFKFNGSFTDFLRHAYLMDAAALSLEWT